MAKKSLFPPKLLGGVESPARVMLRPAVMSPNAKWKFGKSALVWGIKVDGIEPSGSFDALIGYEPTLVPTIWSGKKFTVGIEFEAEDPLARYSFQVIYGCGDPSVFDALTTRPFEGRPASRDRFGFGLDHKRLIPGEILRVTLRVIRLITHKDTKDEPMPPPPVYVYGVWLELEV